MMLPLLVSLLITADNFLVMRFAIIFLGSLILSSCRFVSSITEEGLAVRIGRAKLYKSEIERVIPKGISKEDSLNFARDYINSWAIKQLMFLKAEEELSKEDKNVEQLLEDYKIQLMIFKYENKFITDRLDTVVTEEEMLSYYDDHKEMFVTDDGIVKARYVKIHKNFPNLKFLRALAMKRDVESLEEMERLAYNSAEKYDDFGGKWIDLHDLCREIECDVEQLQNKISVSNVVEISDPCYSKILVVIDKVALGGVSPYEFNIPKIKEIIFGRRKNELISKLHNDLYNEALDKQKLKIIDDEPND